jgi:putative transposase
MRGKRYKEEQIISVLKEAESGINPKELCRKHGISDSTLYHWKRRFSGMEVSDARRLRGLEAENNKLKRLIGDQAIEILALKEINAKKW